MKGSFPLTPCTRGQVYGPSQGALVRYYCTVSSLSRSIREHYRRSACQVFPRSSPHGYLYRARHAQPYLSPVSAVFVRGTVPTKLRAACFLPYGDSVGGPQPGRLLGTGQLFGHILLLVPYCTYWTRTVPFLFASF